MEQKPVLPKPCMACEGAVPKIRLVQKTQRRLHAPHIPKSALEFYSFSLGPPHTLGEIVIEISLRARAERSGDSVRTLNT